MVHAVTSKSTCHRDSQRATASAHSCGFVIPNGGGGLGDGGGGGGGDGGGGDGGDSGGDGGRSGGGGGQPLIPGQWHGNAGGGEGQGTV